MQNKEDYSTIPTASCTGRRPCAGANTTTVLFQCTLLVLAICPEGHRSISWTPTVDTRSHEIDRITFSRDATVEAVPAISSVPEAHPPLGAHVLFSFSRVVPGEAAQHEHVKRQKPFRNSTRFALGLRGRFLKCALFWGTAVARFSLPTHRLPTCRHAVHLCLQSLTARGMSKGSLARESPLQVVPGARSINKRRPCLTWVQSWAILVLNSPGIERSALAEEAGKPTLIVPL